MSSEYNKARLSVKKEFEKKYANEIAELKVFRENSNTVKELQERVVFLESENEQLKDWVERLLTYCDMSEEDLKALKDNLSMTKSFAELTSIMSKVSNRFIF